MHDCTNHKTSGNCKIESCTRKRKAFGKCKQCGATTYKSLCQRHRADGTEKPHQKVRARTNKATATLNDKTIAVFVEGNHVIFPAGVKITKDDTLKVKWGIDLTALEKQPE